MTACIKFVWFSAKNKKMQYAVSFYTVSRVYVNVCIYVRKGIC